MRFDEVVLKHHELIAAELPNSFLATGRFIPVFTFGGKKKWISRGLAVAADPFVLAGWGVPLDHLSLFDALMRHYGGNPEFRSSLEKYKDGLAEGTSYIADAQETYWAPCAMNLTVPDDYRVERRGPTEEARAKFLRVESSGIHEEYLEDILCLESEEGIYEAIAQLADARRARTGKREGRFASGRPAKVETLYQANFDNVLDIYLDMRKLRGKPSPSIEERIATELEVFAKFPMELARGTLPHRMLPFWYARVSGRMEEARLRTFCSFFWIECMGIRHLREHIEKCGIQPTWGRHTDLASQLEAGKKAISEQVTKYHRKRPGKDDTWDYENWGDFK